MELATDLVKVLLPAALVLYGMYMTVKSFLNKTFEKQLLELRTKNTEVVLPVRLQAYERVCLLLERIHPQNLIGRLSQSGYTVADFRSILINEIREEFNHNLSQQVYMSDEAWESVRNAMEDIIVIINTAADNLPADATGKDLGRKVLDALYKTETNPVKASLSIVKNEIRAVF